MLKSFECKFLNKFRANIVNRTLTNFSASGTIRLFFVDLMRHISLLFSFSPIRFGNQSFYFNYRFQVKLLKEKIQVTID